MKNSAIGKDGIVLRKMTERLERVQRYCQGVNYEAFEGDTMLQEACVFNVIQIGELSRYGLSDEIKQAHPELPWREINGLRNHIVHGYEGLRLNIVWETISADFPVLLELLGKLLRETDASKTSEGNA